MPARDRTGPRGQGARTGWGMGYCGDPEDRAAGPRGRGFGLGWGRGSGRGLGRGWGRGMGWGRGFGRGLGRGWGGAGSRAAPADDDVEELRSESSRLKALLKDVERRLSSFERRD